MRLQARSIAEVHTTDFHDSILEEVGLRSARFVDHCFVADGDAVVLRNVGMQECRSRTDLDAEQAEAHGEIWCADQEVRQQGYANGFVRARDSFAQPDIQRPEWPLGRFVLSDQDPLQRDREEESRQGEHEEVEEWHHEESVDCTDAGVAEVCDLEGETKAEDDEGAGEDDAKTFDCEAGCDTAF